MQVGLPKVPRRLARLEEDRSECVTMREREALDLSLKDLLGWAEIQVGDNELVWRQSGD